MTPLACPVADFSAIPALKQGMYTFDDLAPTPTDRLPLLLTVHDAAFEFGVSLRTMRRIIAGGEIAYIRLSPGCIRIRYDDLLVYVEDREVRGG